MIALSNVDAESLLKYATAHLEILSANPPRKVSRAAINEVRILRVLVRKINRKLDKACPERLNNNKQLNNHGKKI